MKEGEGKQIDDFKEDGQKPFKLVNEENIFPGMEKIAPEEMKEYLDDLFRSYIFGKG